MLAIMVPATLRTEQQPGEDLVGRTLGFQQWWRTDQLEAVTDLSRTWVRVPAPETHEHCLLGWETLNAPGATDAWQSGDDWLCDACHERYIRDDPLGLRSGS